MLLLTRYYIHQAGGGGGIGVVPIYSLPPTFREDTESVIIWDHYLEQLNPGSFQAQSPPAKHLVVWPYEQGFKFFPKLLTTRRDTKTSFLNTFRILFEICPLGWQVGVSNANDVLQHAPNAPPLKDADARFPHVVNPRENPSEDAVLNVGLHGLHPL